MISYLVDVTFRVDAPTREAAEEGLKQHLRNLYGFEIPSKDLMFDVYLKEEG